jgi:hypothetical protein
VLGIDTDSPGFSRVKIEPHLGILQKAGGAVPHPQGKITVNYELKKGKWHIEICLPGDLAGTFIWNHHRFPLHAGEKKFEF